ncbi:MAG: Ig-like domain-containing protein [Gemmatimonadaceae bacterium]|nr:Ig-like domain-containing protein [Gemmatimonadaceae bacterium]
MHTSDFARSSRRLTSGAARVLTLALLSCAGLLAASCTEPIPPTPLSSLRILPQADSFFNGVTTTSNPFAVTLLDASGNEIKDNRRITYSSTNTAIFTVDASTGQVTGKANGNALFRATVDGRFIEASVKIISAVDRIQLNTTDFTLVAGQTRQLSPTLVAADGSPISGRAVGYSSSNLNVLTVSTAGLVTAVAEGSAIVSAVAEGKNASVTVTVTREAVASVTLTPVVAQLMRIGGQVQVTATPRNAQGQPLTGRTVNFTSNNPAVATVTGAGLVAALGVGNATITADVEGRTASLGITVTEVPARTVTLEPDTFGLGTGLTRQLTPTVIDSAGRLVTSLNNRQVVWQSTSSIVATVNATGVVTGIGSGTARISVTVDGVKSNDVTVTVTPTVASVRITPINPQLLRVGTSVQLSAQALDNQGQVIPGKTVNWLTNNASVASVSANGLVSGVGVGTTTITAEIDSRTANVSVQVTLVPVGSVAFTPTQDTLIIGDSRQYNPVVRDTAGAIIPTLIGRNVSYIPSNNLVIGTSAAAAGVIVTAGSTPDQATVTGIIDNVSTTEPLSIVVTTVATIQITAGATSIPVNGSTQLTLILKDASGHTLKLNGPRVTYSSSASGIAQPASATGGLTMTINARAVGTAIITVSVGGAIQTITITVT